MLDPLSLAAHVHGHLGWLAAAALVHPAIVLRPAPGAAAQRRAHLAVGLATALVTVASALGAWLYGPYRESVRRLVFLEAPALGLLFERKEHLAFGAVMLAWAGAAAYAAALRPSPASVALRRTAHRAFVGAALLAAAVAAMGTVVAAYRSL